MVTLKMGTKELRDSDTIFNGREDVESLNSIVSDMRTKYYEVENLITDVADVLELNEDFLNKIDFTLLYSGITSTLKLSYKNSIQFIDCDDRIYAFKQLMKGLQIAQREMEKITAWTKEII